MISHMVQMVNEMPGHNLGKGVILNIDGDKVVIQNPMPEVMSNLRVFGNY